jgi:hypothetical protein
MNITDKIASTTMDFVQAIYVCQKCGGKMKISEPNSGNKIPCLKDKKVLYCPACYNTEIE